jgi:hypothetical protein
LGEINGIAVEALEAGGAAVRIGDSPQLGDTQSGEKLPHYQAVGRVLSALRDRSQLIRHLVVPGIYVKDQPEIIDNWIDRFFPR